MKKQYTKQINMLSRFRELDVHSQIFIDENDKKIREVLIEKKQLELLIINFA